jgi:hypothetical protein
MVINLHAIAARVLIVTASVYTASLQLFSPTSLAYRAAGDSWLIDAVNVLVLLLAGVALADLLWRDVLQRGLILPSIPMRIRHRVCVAVYMGLAAAFAVRAFIASGSDPGVVLQVATYYVLLSGGILIEAAAIAHEEREEQDEPCRTASESD